MIRFPCPRFSLRTLVLFVLVVGTLMGLLPFLVPLVAPWSKINCEDQEINIRTGQARFSKYLWYIKISEQVADTPLSLCLEGEQVAVDAGFEQWHMVNRFSVGQRNSPHYLFHGALGQAADFKRYCDSCGLAGESRKAVAREMLSRWQRSMNDGDVDEFLRQLENRQEMTP